jgi:hypothetical protein
VYYPSLSTTSHKRNKNCGKYFDGAPSRKPYHLKDIGTGRGLEPLKPL